ncbi:MAG: GAF domain-containing protein [Chloroflexota bacterium]|jgi:GAF domain-containing protein|nr:hypothetical protein [Anaerolineae bacterium]HMM29805.1 hypothetical protein [Aggregatilineaceae bacterium]
MSRETLVRRLIAFLKRPDTERNNRRESVQLETVFDAARGRYPAPGEHDRSPEAEADAQVLPEHPPTGDYSEEQSTRYYASRLDALVLRAVQQFNAHTGYVLRYEGRDQLRYCTGRDAGGQYVAHDEIDPDRRAIALALESGEAQVFVHRGRDNVARSVLCGPLWDQGALVGLLYLESPARSRLHRAVFDIFCSQVARLVS